MADKVVREKTKIPSIYFNKSTGKYDVKYNYLGYEFDENDVHDVKLLCETFHIEIPKEYR